MSVFSSAQTGSVCRTLLRDKIHPPIAASGWGRQCESRQSDDRRDFGLYLFFPPGERQDRSPAAQGGDIGGKLGYQVMFSSARFTVIVPGFSILKDLLPVSPEPLTVTAPLASVTVTGVVPVHL